MKKQPRVCVVGSINMDLVTTTKKMPEQGETILGEDFATYPGGKGANQAIAAARLGADVYMIGAVGDDAFGRTLRTHFEKEGVLSNGIEAFGDISTGIATIILSENDNRIIVAAGANKEVTPDYIESKLEIILNSDIILLQFEIPMETIEYVVNVADEHHIPVIVNPAPFHTMPENLLQGATYFTPNEIELLAMSKMASFDSVREKMIVTKGEKGVQFWKDGEKTVDSHKVPVKDTTGAGDTFNGALAVELAAGKPLEEAVKLANASAALSITKLGAQGGMPTRSEVEHFLSKNNIN